MNKSGALQITLSKPSSKQLAKIKSKLRQHEIKNKQYNSMCYDIDQNKSQHSYIPHQEKQRKISKKDIHNYSPARLIRSKSKKIDCNIKKLSEEKVQKKNVQELYSQLMTIKSEYKTLKQSYNRLVVEKNDLTEREKCQKQMASGQIQKYNKELQKYRKANQNYQQQIEKMKRECIKHIENEKLKNKRLEQTIQEKDLMIAFLRVELQKAKKGGDIGGSINQSSLFLQHNAVNFNLEYQKCSVSSSIMSNVVVEEHNQLASQKSGLQRKQEQDSLSFSRDKSKEMQSIHSFLTNNDVSLNNNPKKDVVIVETHPSDHQYTCNQQSQESQCLTFQYRGLEQTEPAQIFRNQNKSLKTLLKNEKGKSLNSLPPKNTTKYKVADFTKKIQLQADENSCVDSNKNQSLDTKKYLKAVHSSRQRKNIASKKKKT